MKVFIINTVFGNKSTGNICYELYNNILDHNDDCYVAYGRDSNKEGNKYRIGNKFSNYTHYLFSLLNDSQGFHSTSSTKKLINVIKKINPDIIHLHNLHGSYLNIEIFFNYLKETNIPVIWTLHDCWPFTGHCAYFDYIKCSRWINGCYKCPQTDSYPRSLRDRSKINWNNKKEVFNKLNNMTIVTPSKWLKGLVKESFLKKYQVKVINNGIDLNVFKPSLENYVLKKYNIPQKKIILGVCVGWNNKKGLNDIIELSDLIDDNWIIIIIGAIASKKITLPSNIFHVNFTENQNELIQFYTCADVFINPTHEEVFGMVNIESLACGTPVVMFNSGGSIECIDSNSGIVTKNKSAIDLKIGIDNIMTNKKNYTVNDCIKQAEKFNKKIIYNEYYKLYTKMTNYL